MKSGHVRVSAAIALVFLGTAGCAVGPDYQRPKPPEVKRLTAVDLPAQTQPGAAGEPQSFASGADIPAQWWTLFRSEELNVLIESALKQNQDLKAAEAALRVASELALAQRGALFPQIDAGVSSSRQRVAGTLASPAADGSTLLSLHTAQLTVGYTADVFGGIRRQVESAEAQAEAQRFRREAVYLTLTSNVVVAAIQEALLRAQIDATREIIEAAAKLTEFAHRQRELGQIGAADVAAQETALAQAEATLPPLLKQLTALRHLLAVLTGRYPGDGIAQKFDLESLALPAELPVSLPSALVQQRPDVRAAEASLHAASAQVGVAVANRLPNITLSAAAGSTALKISQLFTSGTHFWGIAADAVQPIFRGGTLLHLQRAAEAAYEQAEAQYRSTVLIALQNVADALQAIDSDTKTLAAGDAAARTARRSLDIARKQWQAGAAGFISVLNAQQAYAQTVVALAQARAARFSDTAALFQALGGGWWNRGDAATAPEGK